MSYLKKYLPILTGILIAVIYGILTRLVFEGQGDISGSLSLSFFGLTPPVLGFLTVALATENQRTSKKYIIMAPWLTCGICFLIAGLFTLEAWFCIVLATPFFMLAATVGGLLAALALKIAAELKSKYLAATALILIAALPYLAAPLEQTFPVQTYANTVHTQIEINAPPEIIWGHITNFQPIQNAEHRPAFFHLIGLPKPQSAEMACEMAGCIRYGYWEDGLAFKGTLLEIIPQKRYHLRLEAEVDQVHPTNIPLHKIDGPNFDMVDDTYEIEYLGQNRSILHLSSSYRLRTRINPYGAFWIDLILHDLQNYILRIEKERSERQYLMSLPPT